MGKYAGAWKKSTVDRKSVPLVTARDPEHADPTPNLSPVTWVQDTVVPSIPDEWLGGQSLQLPTIHGMAQDETPRDHAVGMGVGAAMSTYEAIDERTGAHGDDRGAVEARRFAPSGTREGTYHVAVVDDQPGNGASPSYPTMRYERGVGVGSDPGARVGRRIARWRERTIDMHRWDAEGRASVARYAYHASNSPGQPGSGPYTSDEPLYAEYGLIGSPDQFVVPMSRRSPRPWDEALTVDGVDPAATYGLTAWGL